MDFKFKFKDIQHQDAFNKSLKKAKVKDWDKERISLFYALTIFEKTRNHINDLYDFKEDSINIEGLKQEWQSERTIKATKLAFNLFNNFHGLSSECDNYSPLELFSLSKNYRCFMLMAVRIRFS